MNVVKKKLNSTRGASMLIALIYLLTALMVGTVVLTAASSNVGRITHNRQDQREYYAVESAMELIRADMQSEEFSAWYSKTDEYVWVEPVYEKPDDPSSQLISDGYYSHTGIEYQEGADLTAGGVLQTKKDDFERNYFSSAVYEEISGGNTVPSKMVYDLHFTADGDAKDKIPGVAGKLTVNMDSYDVTVELWVTDDENSAVKSNPVTMNFEALVKSGSSTSGTKSGGSITETHEITVTWGEPSIMKGVSE